MNLKLMKMKLRLPLTIASLTMLLIACSQPEFATDQDKFEAFLKTKRIALDDETQVARVRAEYERRAALANAIYSGDLLDRATLDAEVEEFRKELLISRYFEQYLSEAVTEQGIQNYYNDHVEQYQSRKAKVAHILFRTNPRMDDTERQVVLSKAAEAYSRISAGEDFAAVAKAVSEDRVSAEQGGDLGWINEGAVSAGFSNKVFGMQTGEVSEPFLTDFGFHIVKLEEAPQQVTRSLETLKGDIRYQLRNESKTAEIDRLLDQAGYAAPESVQQ